MEVINLNIKEEFKSTIVGFNGSGLPLGDRKDLHLLAEMAQYDKNLARVFEELPTPDQIKAYKEELFLQNHPVSEVESKSEPVILAEENNQNVEEQ